MTLKPTRSQSDLRDGISEALKDAPGATSLCLFGSLADGSGDAFSDIDMEAAVAGALPAREAVVAALERVAPVDAVYVLNESDRGHAITVVFDGVSCYHTLDFGLRLEERTADAFSHVAGPKRVLWVQEPPSHSAPCAQETWYEPEPGTFDHLALGLVIGGIRYAKARKRNRNLTCWRFASAQAEWLWAILYATRTGKGVPESKLQTPEYGELDSLLDAEETAELQRMCDFSNPDSMDGGFVALLTRSIDEAAPATQPHPCIGRLLQSVRDQLG